VNDVTSGVNHMDYYRLYGFGFNLIGDLMDINCERFYCVVELKWKLT